MTRGNGELKAMRALTACLGFLAFVAATPAPQHTVTPAPRHTAPPAPQHTAAPGPQQAAKFEPGLYKQIDTVTKKIMPVGSQIIIVAGKGGTLGFSISAIRQLDSNQGFIAGTLPATMPATWTKAEEAANCKLVFDPLPHGFKVTQDAGFGDCGFGGGVTAAGTYTLAEKP
jgi:hypothetical protein